MEVEYLIQPVEETRMTIFDSAIDLGTDVSEICIDMLQDEGIVKDIPVLGTVYKVGKIGYSVARLTFIKKVLAFAQEIQRNDVDKNILMNYQVLNFQIIHHLKNLKEFMLETLQKQK